jgi:hypothetical protein
MVACATGHRILGLAADKSADLTAAYSFCCLIEGNVPGGQGFLAQHRGRHLFR